MNEITQIRSHVYTISTYKSNMVFFRYYYRNRNPSRVQHLYPVVLLDTLTVRWNTPSFHQVDIAKRFEKRETLDKREYLGGYLS